MAAPKTSSCPAGLVEHSYEREFPVDESQQYVWDWLNDPETFIRGQPWPYFVEFVGGGFEPGVQNTHSGPFVHCCGEVGEVRAPEYRDLRYHYGAFVLRMRWIRPTRLQFWVSPVEADDSKARCTVRVRLDSQCRSWLRGPWNFSHRFFWKFFGWSMRRGLRRAARQRKTRANAQATA